MLFRAILIGAGDTTTGLFVTLARTPIAWYIEWALMFGRLGLPAIGVRGAAIGVAIGQIFALAVGMWVLFGAGAAFDWSSARSGPTSIFSARSSGSRGRRPSRCSGW